MDIDGIVFFTLSKFVTKQIRGSAMRLFLGKKKKNKTNRTVRELAFQKAYGDDSLWVIDDPVANSLYF